MSTFPERIRIILSEMEGPQHGKQSRLAQIAGCTRGLVNQWKIGIHETMGYAYAKNIEKALGYSVSWVLDGTGAKQTGIGATRYFVSEEASGVGEFTVSDHELVPVKTGVLNLKAGSEKFNVVPIDNDDLPFVVRRHWINTHGYVLKRLIAIKVSDDSMEPALYEGDTIIINTADRQFLDGVAFAINYEGQLSLKRMMRDGGEWWLASDHPDQRRFPRKLYRVGDCNPIGRIVYKQSAQI